MDLNYTGKDLVHTVAEKKAIIFDLFHTLTALETTWGDSRPFTYQMLGVSKQEWDRQLLERSRARLMGENQDAVAIVAEMAHAIDPSIAADVIRAATANRIARFAGALIKIPEETMAVLRALKSKDKRIGLISNADTMEVAAWRQSPIAPLFDSTLFSCAVGCVKPEPRLYHISLRALGVTPASALFVGDGGSNELEGARTLGITTVMIAGIIREIWPDKIPERRRHADFVIERLPELVA